MIDSALLKDIYIISNKTSHWEYTQSPRDLVSFVVKIQAFSIPTIISYLAAQPTYNKKVEFSSRRIVEIASTVRVNTINSIYYLISHPKFTSFNVHFNPKGIHYFFKGLSKSYCHALSEKNFDLGFLPTEPQVTNGICSFIYGGVSTELKKKRTLSFLKALLSGVKNRDKFIDSFNAGGITDFQVLAEQSVLNNMRIDLLITWSEGNNKFAVIVEAKFGHKITKGQLSGYKKYITNKIKAENRALILLTRNGLKAAKSQDRTKEWKTLTWFNLLRRWEYEVDTDGDNDIDFLRFRRLIWNKIKGN